MNLTTASALRALLLSAVGLLSTSCGRDPCSVVLCGPCPPSLELQVTDAATGKPPVSGVTVTGAALDCVETGTATVCSARPTVGPGSYTLDVAAAGYAGQRLTVSIARAASDACCTCGYVPQVLQVKLAASGG
jgi:hypothetical protein